MINKDNKYWKSKLDKLSYKVLREAATEIPFSGKYNLHFKNGNYRCKGCDAVLFESDSKFDSGCGWPSFDRAKKGSITYRDCLLYTSPSPRDATLSRMPSSA